MTDSISNAVQRLNSQLPLKLRQAGDTENISLFNLEDAIAFGAGFFTPLLQD